jgi:hypothetical protein
MPPHRNSAPHGRVSWARADVAEAPTDPAPARPDTVAGPAASQRTAFDRRDAVFVACVVVCAVALRWSALDVAPMSDDYLQYGMVRGLVPGDAPAWDLYALFSADPLARDGQLAAGLVPWWTAADFHAGVLRPLPSLLLWLDHTVAPRNAMLHHAHSMVWWAALVAITGGLLRRLLPRPIAWVALISFAVDPSASLPLSWLANRAVIVSATLGFVAIWAHVRWREAAVRRRPWWPALTMLAAFSTGEYGLVAAAYVLAYEWVHRRGPQTWRASWPARLGPALVPACAYLTWHGAGGYGMAGSEFYADPWSDPGAYLSWLLDRGPRLVAALVAPLPPSSLQVAQRYGVDLVAWAPVHVAWACAAITVGGALAWWSRRAWTAHERRALAWLSAGALLGVLPLAVAPSHDRLLVLSQLGGSAVVGGLLVAAWRIATRAPGVPRLAGAVVGLALGWGHGPDDVRFGRAQIREHADLARHATAIALSADDAGLDLRGRHVVVLSTSAQTIMLHGALVADYHRRRVPATWHVVSSVEAPLDVRRLDAHSLEVWHLGDRTWLDAVSARIFRPDARSLAVGDIVDAGPLSAQVTAERDGQPARVHLRFADGLDDPALVFLILQGGRLRPWAVPQTGRIALVPAPSETLAPP